MHGVNHVVGFYLVVQCLSSPMNSLYKGGIIQNSEFNSGLMGWLVPVGVQAGVSSSPSGNKYASAKSKGQPSRSVYQKIQMQTNTHYALSGEVNCVSSIAPKRKYACIDAYLYIYSSELVIEYMFLLQHGCRFHPALPR
jgi:hypothetical protein